MAGMKLCNWVLVLSLACVALVAGCGKGKSADSPSAETINATKLRPAFASAGPEAQALVDKAMTSIQSSMYPDALAALDQLANLPNLTPQQKETVTAVIEQTKKKMAALQSGAPK
jgi:hypothetical protein